jgi:hypothetical protein
VRLAVVAPAGVQLCPECRRGHAGVTECAH